MPLTCCPSDSSASVKPQRKCLVNNRTTLNITHVHPHLYPSGESELESTHFQQESQFKSHLNLLCHIHFTAWYGSRTEHQFWCLTDQYPFSRVYMRTWALWINLLSCCSRVEKFHKALSESDNWLCSKEAALWSNMNKWHLLRYRRCYNKSFSHGGFLLQVFMGEQISAGKLTILEAHVGLQKR